MLQILCKSSLAPLALAISVATAAPPEFEIEVYSDKVQNATAICFDDRGRLYVTETFRWRNGVEDNRDHTYWIMDDLATETNEQRVAYYNKYASEKTRRSRLLHQGERAGRRLSDPTAMAKQTRRACSPPISKPRRTDQPSD